MDPSTNQFPPDIATPLSSLSSSCSSSSCYFLPYLPSFPPSFLSLCPCLFLSFLTFSSSPPAKTAPQSRCLPCVGSFSNSVHREMCVHPIFYLLCPPPSCPSLRLLSVVDLKVPTLNAVEEEEKNTKEVQAPSF